MRPSTLARDMEKELRLLLRDRRALLVALLLPVLIIYSYGAVAPEQTDLLPGNPSALVLALAVMLPGLMTSSYAIVREKTAGTLSRLVKTPMSALEFLLGKFLSHMVLAALQVVLLILLALNTLPGVTTRNAEDLFLLLLLTSASSLALGLLFSAFCNSDQQVSNIVPLAILVMMVMSGFFKPLDQMGPAGTAALALPFTHGYSALFYTFKTDVQQQHSFTLNLILETILLLGITYLFLRIKRK